VHFGTGLSIGSPFNSRPYTEQAFRDIGFMRDDFTPAELDKLCAAASEFNDKIANDGDNSHDMQILNILDSDKKLHLTQSIMYHNNVYEPVRYTNIRCDTAENLKTDLNNVYQKYARKLTINKNDYNEIKRVLDECLKGTNATVYGFGSRVKRYSNQDSDLDIVIDMNGQKIPAKVLEDIATMMQQSKSNIELDFYDFERFNTPHKNGFRFIDKIKADLLKLFTIP
jgi:predicted nucleotidyltransferase